ncbi:MAG: hypothetical protein MMC33_001303 [Icmadophila ericetorum]|nr:hypothetical protein [Icmadophila ericetorum]
MLQDKQHSKWTCKKVDKQLCRLLDSAGDACVDLINQIKQRLDAVSKEIDGIVKDKPSTTVGEQFAAWKDKVKERLRFTFSESHLQAALADLTSLNGDLGKLSAQRSRLEACRRLGFPSSTLEAHPNIVTIQTIHEASKRVHGALSKCCTKHTDDITHLCLEADAPDDTQKHGQSQKHHGDSRTSLSRTHKREHDQAAGGNSRTPHWSVRLQNSNTATIQESLSYRETNEEETSNIRMWTDFCDQLRKCLVENPQTVTCLGTLDDVEHYKHLFYFHPNSLQRKCGPGTSLEEVISSLSHQGSLSWIPYYERLHLARSIATALLCFYETP